MIKTLRTHYSQSDRRHEEGLENILNRIGWENILQVLPCYCGNGECFYTVIYKVEDEI